MAAALADVPARPLFTNDPNVRIMTASVAIGAAGAVDSTIAGYRVPSGITVANTGTGTFSVVFPPCISGLLLPSVEVSAAATVTEAILTAVNFTAGTATLRTSKAGTAANPASGDLIALFLYGLTTAVTS